MNIYEFINSKDIRAHCEKIGHTFNSVEAAFLIYQSQNHTLTEKHDAWKELIETMPDMAIEERFHCPHYESLHDFLRQYMALEDRWLTVFFQADGDWFYRFDPVVRYPDDSYKDGQNFKRETGELVHHSFSDGLAFEKEEWEESQFFYVEKMHICGGSHKRPSKICILFDSNGVPLEISELQNVMTEAEADLYYAFEGMWIDVPTPFQKGDIVFANHQISGRLLDPFVLISLCTDKDTEAHRRRYKIHLKNGDTSDMYMEGYRLERSNGEIWYDCNHGYLSLEYFRGDMSGHRRVLKVIRDFYQNKLDIAACMTAYHYILTEESWKQQKWNNSYMLENIGILEKDTEKNKL